MQEQVADLSCCVIMETEHRSGLQRIAIIAAFVWQVGSTALPALGFGEPIGQRSDGSRSLITPAGWAFSIWGLLYLASGIFAIWQALPGQRANRWLNRFGWAAAGIFFFNGLWAFYTQFADLTGISVVIIAMGLACALLCVRIISAEWAVMQTGERWLAAPVLSALAGWLTAATIVNVAAALSYHGLAVLFPAEVTAAAITIIGAIIVATAVGRSRGNPWYALPFLWALLAIFFAGGQEAASLKWATIGAALIVSLTMVRALSDQRNRAHWFG